MSFPKGEERFREKFPDFAPLSIAGLLREMELFVSRLELRRTVFRSDHASNWLVLKGTLGADKARLLAQLRAAIAAPELAPLVRAWGAGALSMTAPPQVAPGTTRASRETKTCGLRLSAQRTCNQRLRPPNGGHRPNSQGQAAEMSAYSGR